MNGYQRTISLLLYAFARLGSLLPSGMLYFKASVLQFFGERIIRYRYQVIVQNLSRAFPEKNYNEIKRLAHEFYRHFFEIFAEVIKSCSFSQEQARKHLNVVNPELVNDYHERGINVIALCGHRGNWEWFGLIPLHFRFSIYTLYKPLSNKIMEGLVNRIRLRFGLKLLPMQQAARYILSKKDYPALYIFVGDQSPSHQDPGYCVDFMHQPSFLFTGGARLARATGSAVVYVSFDKVKRGHYSIRFIPVSEPDKNLREINVLETYARLLEEDIRRQPAYWLWSHKRWKNSLKTAPDQ